MSMEVSRIAQRSRRLLSAIPLLVVTSCGNSGKNVAIDAGQRSIQQKDAGHDAGSDGHIDSSTERPSDGGPLVVSHPRILFDTDMGPDVDDAGALAILHVLADRGELDLLGVGISTVGDAHTPAISFVDAVNTYYGRPDIPIGLWKGKGFGFFDPYASDVASNPSLYPHDLGDSNDGVPSAAGLYRHLLSGEADDSVTMVCVGPMNNLLALLDSPPDADSMLDGAQLVAAKVARLVQMGGDYPTGSEFNFLFQPDPGTTRAALDRWPTPIVFSGFALGTEILTGSALADTPASNPVRRAYELYTGNLGGLHQSWDLTAALAASRGTGADWSLSPPGTNHADDSGQNTFTQAPGGPHRYLERRVDASTIADELNALLATPPRVGDAGDPSKRQ